MRKKYPELLEHVTSLVQSEVMVKQNPDVPEPSSEVANSNMRIERVLDVLSALAAQKENTAKGICEQTTGEASEAFDLGLMLLSQQGDPSQLLLALLRAFPDRCEAIARSFVAALQNGCNMFKSVISLLDPTRRSWASFQCCGEWYELMGGMLQPAVLGAFLDCLSKGEKSWCYLNIADYCSVFSLDPADVSRRLTDAAMKASHPVTKSELLVVAMEFFPTNVAFGMLLELRSKASDAGNEGGLLADAVGCRLLEDTCESAKRGCSRREGDLDFGRWQDAMRRLFLEGLANGRRWCYTEHLMFHMDTLSIDVHEAIRQILSYAVSEEDPQIIGKTLASGPKDLSGNPNLPCALADFSSARNANVDAEGDMYNLWAVFLKVQCAVEIAELNELENQVTTFLNTWTERPLYREKAMHAVIHDVIGNPRLWSLVRYSRKTITHFKFRLLEALFQIDPSACGPATRAIVDSQISTDVKGREVLHHATISEFIVWTKDSVERLRVAVRCRPLVEQCLIGPLLHDPRVQNMVVKSLQLGDAAVVYHLLHLGIRVSPGIAVARLPWDVVFLIGSFAMPDMVLLPRKLRVFPSWIEWDIDGGKKISESVVVGKADDPWEAAAQGIGFPQEVKYPTHEDEMNFMAEYGFDGW